MKNIAKTDLVVVILSCVLILALSGAAGRTARIRAKENLCSAHLKQWALGLKMFTDDNNGLFMNYCSGQGRMWAYKLEDYIKDEKLLMCPEARKTEDEGATQPFVADIAYGEKRGSYGLNDWVLSAMNGSTEEPYDSLLWKTPYVQCAANVPLLLGASQMYLINPSYSDDPPADETDVWGFSPTAWGEMPRFCVNRHVGANNILYMDFSARKTGLKKLWDLDWHRDWNPGNDPLPDWPEWMSDFKDYR